MTILQDEKINAYSHGVLIPVMTAGAILLAITTRRNIELEIFSIVYGISAVILFTASFLYHAMKKSKNEKSVWRKLDRSAIFVLIAGTSTPLCFLYLNGTVMRMFLAVMWLSVLSGIAVLSFLNVPRKISTLIYLSIGTICIIPVLINIPVIPPAVFSFFIAGDISYIAGAIIYGLKKPNLHMGFHEIFHMFVIIGAVFHMLMIIAGVNIYLQS